LAALLDYLENLALANWVRSSPSVFAYSTILSAHGVGLGIVVGVITLIALRLLGVAPDIPLTALRRLYGIVWIGFLINLVSGLLLFIAEAHTMAAMVAFWAKLLFVAAGMCVAELLKRRYFTDLASVQAGVVTRVGRKLAMISLGCWYLALIAGRLTAYPDMVNGWLHLSGGST
jgi:membrane-bound metal-dependent hydrolase YbcI (DUF457 family)